MDNLKYYNAGRVVPEEAQKPFSNGKFSGTDINPMWRIKRGSGRNGRRVRSNA